MNDFWVQARAWALQSNEVASILFDIDASWNNLLGWIKCAKVKDLEQINVLTVPCQSLVPVRLKINHKARDWKQNEEKEVIAYDGLIRDITDRKSAELALKESEQRYKHLVDSVTDYIYTVHIKKGKAIKTEHGPMCQKVTGYTSREYDEDPDLWHQMVFTEDKKNVIRSINHALKGESPGSFEHRMIHKDGSIKWVKNTIVLRKDAYGIVYAYDGLISDITDRKRAEELAEAQKIQLIQAISNNYRIFLLNSQPNFIE